MTWPQWVSAVLAIAAARGLIVNVTYPTPTWATFNWRCPNGSRFGSCGAGADFIYLTSPEEYTWDWYCTNPTQSRKTKELEEWERKGRHVPRVPAMATAAALKALFRV